MKKIIALALALVLAFGCFGISSFAAEEEVKYGDVNGDNLINSMDALAVLKSATGITNLSVKEIAIADVTADRKVNSNDALAILKSATGSAQITKSYSSTKKAKNIDTTFNSTAYTFSINYKVPEEDGVTIKDGAMEMVFTTNGTSKAIVSKMEIDMKDALNEAGFPTLVSIYFPVEYRLLHLNGKNYELMPAMEFMGQTITEATYEETQEDISFSFDSYVSLFTIDMIYSGTDTNGTERFIADEDMICDFYFSGNTPTKLVISQGTQTEEFGLNYFKKTAETSYLTLNGFSPAA